MTFRLGRLSVWGQLAQTWVRTVTNRYEDKNKHTHCCGGPDPLEPADAVEAELAINESLLNA